MGIAPLERVAVIAMKRGRLAVICFLIALSVAVTQARARPMVIIVTGASGADEYAEEFKNWSKLWEKAARDAEAKTLVLGLDEPETDAQRLEQILQGEPKEGADELWLVLIGHGSFDGQSAKFNLRNSDVSAEQLKSWLQPIQRPIAVIDLSSASGPFLKALSAPNRVIITATRSGHEHNYARFGGFLSAVIAGQSQGANDLDKDGQTSLLEAWLAASREVAEWYRNHNRLATEHSLLDDNADGLGTSAEAFRGLQPITKPAAPDATLDGALAKRFCLVQSRLEHELPAKFKARRDELEAAITKLRQAKEKTPEEKYYRQLEALLLDLARLYESAGREH